MTKRLVPALAAIAILACRSADHDNPEEGPGTNGAPTDNDTITDHSPAPDGGMEDGSVEPGDTESGQPLGERQPLSGEVLAGDWVKVLTSGPTVTLTLGATGDAARSSTDEARFPSFEAGTWSLENDTITLSFESGGYQGTESFTAALVEDKLYDKVLLRAPASAHTLDGEWTGALSWRMMSLIDATDIDEREEAYTLVVQGQAFATTEVYTSTVVFGSTPQTTDETYIGRGTVSLESGMIHLSYVESGYLGALEPLDPPLEITWGRRIAEDVIYLEGEATSETDQAYIRTR
jgi:hypothetical protein